MASPLNVFGLLAFYTITVNCLETGDLKLVDGDSYSGRLEIFFYGEYGTVCSIGFGAFEADVVCKQLGFIRAINFGTALSLGFPIGNFFTLNHLSNVHCETPEFLHILNCSYSSVSTCSHDYDLAVECSQETLQDNPYDLQLRLFNGSSLSNGRLEVYCNGQWGTVCSDGFGFNDADTACRQLGYTQAEWFNHLSIEPADSLQPIWLANLTCIASEHACIADCPASCPTEDVGCTHDKDVVLECSNKEGSSLANEPSKSGDCIHKTDVEPTSGGNGGVRLWRNGSPVMDSYGVVQYYENGEWGNVCNDAAFGVDEANTVCRQLGFTGALSYGSVINRPEYGYDLHRTILNDVSCAQTDTVLYECATISSLYVDSSCKQDIFDVFVSCYSIHLSDSPYPGMIRLVDGDFVTEGRVEVYCNGKWGTVCSSGVGLQEANTICRQLGYTVSTSYGSILPGGNSSQPIWMDSLDCGGVQKTCIQSCKPCPLMESNNCSHTQDLTVYCTSTAQSTNNVQTCTALYEDVTAPDGTIRLVQNGQALSSYTFGIIQLHLNNEWGNICADYFGMNEGDVICHQLGFSGVQSYSQAFGSSEIYGQDYHKRIISNLYCSNGDFLTFSQCTYNYMVTSCTGADTHDAQIQCYTDRIWDNPFAGMSRLMEGNYPSEGRVEVYCNEQWGTVCNDGFGENEADTVCRQLGYDTALSFDSLSLESNIEAQPIWLQEVNCRSSVWSCLSVCQMCPPLFDSSGEVDTCNHTQDVTVQCGILANSANTVDISTCEDYNPITTTTSSTTSTPTASTTVTASPTEDCGSSVCVAGLEIENVIIIAGVLLLIIILFCCTGFCYACYKSHCSCENPGDFCIHWLCGSICCVFYITYQFFCVDHELEHYKKKARKRRRELEELETEYVNSQRAGEVHIDRKGGIHIQMR